MQRRLAAILFADVVGYSRLMAADEAGTHTALRAFHKDTIEPLITGHRGRIVKLMGDGILVEFASVVDAVACALAWQATVASNDDPALQFRIGIGMGDIIVEDGDVYGDGVNVASRLESIATPGGICISAVVHDQIARRITASFRDLGDRQLKNIDRPVRVWQWLPETPSEPQPAPVEPKPTAPTDKPSIAVLPFDNMSGDPEQGYFADGITEDLITEIARLPELLVIARNSVFTYKGQAVCIPDICRDLGVRYVLEGSVRKAGERVRITAQLIDGQTGGHIWAERYDRTLTDVFAIQDDVTEQIVHALEVKLVDGAFENRKLDPTRNIEAYDCVLRAREQYRTFSEPGNATARGLYERAIALDPDYAEPYAGLAETYVHDWLAGKEPSLDRALAFSQQASARDPTLPLVLEALSTVYLFQRQHAEAVATARRWIELEPNNADAYATLAGALNFSGRNEEVLTLIDRAKRLNPFYPFYYPHYIGMAQTLMGRFDEAIVFLKRAIVRNPDALWPHVYLAACHGHLDNTAEGADQVTEILRISPDFSIADLRRLLPYKDDADATLLIDGLYRAGLSG